MTMRRLAVLGIACLLALPAQAGFVTNPGDPPDNGYLSDRVCCVDVAASNILAFLARTKAAVRETLGDPKAEQENFHAAYDPGFTSPGGASAADALKGWRDTLAGKGLRGDVKLFGTRDLSYARLVQEWNDDEMITLLMSSSSGGHAVLLWGLDDDPNAAAPEIAVVDPNVHPNTNQTVDGTATGATGTSTRVPLTIGTDANGLPSWTFTLPAGSYTYPGTDTEFDWPAVDYRITGFISVSDVGKIPVPATAVLLVPGLAALLLIRRRAA
jgi:hypothetical protein